MEGFESAGNVAIRENSATNRDTAEPTPEVDSDPKCAIVGSPVTGGDSSADHVERALAEAIGKAAAAGAWAAVEAMTAELRARREARARVVSLDVERARRGR